MKKIMVIVLLIAIGHSVFSQHSDTVQVTSKTDFLQKSKNQKTAAWLLLGGGAVLTAVGAITFSNTFSIWSSNSEEAISAVAAAIGVAAMAGSIPLFIASARNKGKSMNVNAGLRMENNRNLKQGAFSDQPYPALSVSIPLK